MAIDCATARCAIDCGSAIFLGMRNADSMDLFQLQSLMQHKSLETTRLYVNMANRLKQAVDNLKVPEVLRNSATG